MHNAIQVLDLGFIAGRFLVTLDLAAVARTSVAEFVKFHFRSYVVCSAVSRFS